MFRSVKQGLFVAGLAVAVAFLLNALLGEQNLADGAPFRDRPRIINPDRDTVVPRPKVVEKIVERATDEPVQPEYVVKVKVERGPLTSDSGTGTLIREDLVLTAHHNVRALGVKIMDEKLITVTFVDGTVRDAKVIGFDKDDDFALLQFEAVELAAAVIGDANPVEGDEILIGGFPMAGKYQEIKGKVAGFGAPLRDSQRDSIFYVNAKGISGMSGAGAFNSKGELAGVMFGTLGRANCSDVEAVKAFIDRVLPNEAKAPEPQGGIDVFKPVSGGWEPLK